MVAKIVTVYSSAPNGALTKAGEVEHSKLVFVSATASKSLAKSTSGKTWTVPESKVHPDALKWICGWAAKYNTKRPFPDQHIMVSDIKAPLGKPNASGEPTIFDIVRVFSGSNKIEVPDHVKGNELRQEIWRYIHASALTKDEFQMIYEWLGVSYGILKSAAHQLMMNKVWGPVPPEIGAIEEYAKTIGMFEELKAIEKGHQDRKDARDRNRAAQQARLADQARRAEDRKQAQKDKAQWSETVAKDGYAAVAKKAGNGKKGGQ